MKKHSEGTEKVLQIDRLGFASTADIKKIKVKINFYSISWTVLNLCPEATNFYSLFLSGMDFVL